MRRITVLMAFGIAFALSISPAFAYAGDLSAASERTLQPVAANKTVYLLQKVTETSSSTSKTVRSYSYKKGLLTKEVASTTYGTGTPAKTISKWAYDSKNDLKKYKTSIATVSFGLDSRGLPKTATLRYGVPSTSWQVSTISYKSGKVRSVTFKEHFVVNGVHKEQVSMKKSYKYKKGKLVKISANGSATNRISYDKKGNLASFSYGSAKHTFKNSYGKSGLTKKRVMTNSAGKKTTYTYTYKPVKVNSSLYSKVKAQQWALLNMDVNFALGTMFNEVGVG